MDESRVPDERFDFTDIPLTLEETKLPDEVCAVGIAFATFSPQLAVETADPEAVDAGDDAAIEDIIARFEAMDPETFIRDWKSYAAEPYVGVGNHWVGLIDEANVKHWFESDNLARARVSFPPFSPRKITVSKVSIVHLEPTRAVVTYHVEEEYRNGRVTAGNTCSIVMKTARAGWKIVVNTKGSRHPQETPTLRLVKG